MAQSTRGSQVKPAEIQTIGGKLGRFMTVGPGRRIVHFTSVGLAFIAGTGYYILHTYGQSWYQKQIRLYKDGMIRKIPAGLMDLMDEVIDDLKLDPSVKSYTSPFLVSGFTPTVIGSYKFRKPVLLGVPVSFTFTNPDQAEFEAMQINQQPVQWARTEAIDLKQAIFLSDNAKKFVMAQLLTVAQSHQVFLNSVMAATSIMGYSFTTIFINEKTFGFFRPFTYRLVVYLAAGLFWYGAWSSGWSLYNKHVEKKGDMKAARISLDYAKGGLEYYTKLLKRNQCLRELMGPAGDKYYTVVGDFKYFLRPSYLPLVERKKIVSDIAMDIAKPEFTRRPPQNSG